MKFKAVPLDFLSEEIESFENAVKIFNNSQNQFEIELVDPVNHFDSEIISWDKSRDYLKRIYSKSKVIAVTSKRFSDNWFSHTEEKISVISTFG